MSPKTAQRLHFWLTLGWLASAAPVVAVKGLRESIPLLVFISIYANVAGHFSAWQAARAERLVDENSPST